MRRWRGMAVGYQYGWLKKVCTRERIRNHAVGCRWHVTIFMDFHVSFGIPGAKHDKRTMVQSELFFMIFETMFGPRCVLFSAYQDFICVSSIFLLVEYTRDMSSSL